MCANVISSVCRYVFNTHPGGHTLLDDPDRMTLNVCGMVWCVYVCVCMCVCGVVCVCMCMYVCVCVVLPCVSVYVCGVHVCNVYGCVHVCMCMGV